MSTQPRIARALRSLLTALITGSGIALAGASPCAANLLSNPSFDAVGPAGSPTTNPTAAPGGAGLSAADAWGLFHNSAPATTYTELMPTTLPGTPGRMIYVETDRDRNGLVNVFDSFNAGPASAYAWVWVLPRSGTASMGTGNGGNTGFNASTVGTGQWEFLQASNGVSPANEFILYSDGGPAAFMADEAGVVAIQHADPDRVPVEYSNWQDERSIPGGGAHGAPDPGQVLYTQPIDTAADSWPIDVIDHAPGIEDGNEPDEQIDALASGQDFGFDPLVDDQLPLLVSLGLDLGTAPPADPVAVWREEPGSGLTDVEYFQTDLDATDADPDRRSMEDLDALDLWGPLYPDADARFYSLWRDFDFSVLVDVGGTRMGYVPTTTVHAALLALGFNGSVDEVDVDALMVKDTGPALDAWDIGDELLISIRRAANFDGGEIVHIFHNPVGAVLRPPRFLRHGGHVWDTAFSVAGAFGVDSENVDALEATLVQADLDTDQDGIGDERDNCPDWWNADQSDLDGNGRGDACECGDQDGNGTVNIADLLAINRVIFEREQASPLCDTDEDGLCNVSDVLGANARIFGAPAFCARYPSR